VGDRKHETRVEKQLRLMLETECRKMGDRIKEGCPPGAGFALFMFDFGDETSPGAVAYVANGERAGVLALVKEWIKRQESDNG
jgi:hypothetical protein